MGTHRAKSPPEQSFWSIGSALSSKYLSIYMTENWIVQIDFKDQMRYELNKGYIKDIIKHKFGLSDFDALSQRWYNKSNLDVEVKRLVDGFKTIGLKVAGNRLLADALVNYVKDMIGVTIIWLDNSVDNEINEIISIETNKFSAYINDRFMKGEVSREKADNYIKRWADAVSFYEYEKRGVEY